MSLMNCSTVSVTFVSLGSFNDSDALRFGVFLQCLPLGCGFGFGFFVCPDSLALNRKSLHFFALPFSIR